MPPLPYAYRKETAALGGDLTQFNGESAIDVLCKFRVFLPEVFAHRIQHN